MATLKETIATILHNDAVLTGSENLGTLLGYNATTKPDCVFYQYPPETPSVPLVTYRLVGGAGRFPRYMFLDITVFGGNFSAIHARIYTLLNERLQVTATDWSVKGLLYESGGPELYDDNLKCYFQRERYQIIACKP